MGEFNFIDSIRGGSLIHEEGVRQGIGDDCAVLESPKYQDTLVTTDTMVEGVHFKFSYMTGFDVGYRLATANLSDIAAMGGRPLAMTINVAASGDTEIALLQDIYKGLMECARRYHVNLVGGDTVHTEGPMVLTLTLLGQVEEGQALLRSGAKPQDIIFVTGDLGLAQTGLEVLLHDPKLEDQYPMAVDRHKRPKPAIKLGQAFRQLGAHSLNDISDGLASELHEIAKASGVSLMIDEKYIPINANTQRWCREVSQKNPTDYALYGGEDFQLVGTAPQAYLETLQEMVGVSLIGIVTQESKSPIVTMRDVKGRTSIITPKGYNHFGGDSHD